MNTSIRLIPRSEKNPEVIRLFLCRHAACCFFLNSKIYDMLFAIAPDSLNNNNTVYAIDLLIIVREKSSKNEMDPSKK